MNPSRRLVTFLRSQIRARSSSVENTATRGCIRSVETGEIVFGGDERITSLVRDDVQRRKEERKRSGDRWKEGGRKRGERCSAYCKNVEPGTAWRHAETRVGWKQNI